jgi:hypothetical protein
MVIAFSRLFVASLMPHRNNEDLVDNGPNELDAG